MKTRIVQTSFASGEISPQLFGRVDREIYHNGAKELRNVIIAPQGGVRRRPGTAYIANTASDAAARLLPFQFDSDNNYLLVFTPGVMTVYKNSAVVATVSSSPISTLTAPIIAGMKFAQSLNTMILVHPDLPPIRILRVSDSSWTCSTLSISNIPSWDFGSGAEASWSATRGWPVSATFWKSRLWFGGSKQRANTIWGSKLAGFFDFNLGTGQPADAIEATIDSDELSKIENIFGVRTLQIFTQGGEYFNPITLNSTVTPETFALEVATRYGSSSPMPINADGATVYVDFSGRTIREFLFLDVEQNYTADDISYLSEHFIDNPVSIALQKGLTELAGMYAYFVNADGTIAVLNRRRSQQFLAWSLWQTDGEYEQVCVTGNEIFAIVKRGAERFIERFDFARYTDAGLVLTGGPKTSWTGLSHLEGEEVSVRAGAGFPLLNNTVDSGGITTEQSVASIEAGLPYEVIVTPVAPVDKDAVTSGKRRRMVSVNMLLSESDSFDILYGDLEQDRVSFIRFGDVTFGQPIPSYTGWHKMQVAGFSRSPTFTLKQSLPVRFNVLSVGMEVTV